jgi:Endoplasmic reticulum vesicle transporter
MCWWKCNPRVNIIAAKSRLNEEDQDLSDEEHEWAEKVRKHRQRLHHSWVDADHPGCQLSGHLLLDRVPGNFHIQARSPHHDLVPHLTNVSHVIHSLTIGEPVASRLIDHGVEEGYVNVPPSFVSKLTPMNGNAYINYDLHEAYHHYLKVVTTNVEGLKMGQRQLKAYQVIQNSQLAYYRNDIVPEAKVCSQYTWPYE